MNGKDVEKVKKKIAFLIVSIAVILSGCGSDSPKYSKEEMNKAYKGIFDKMDAEEYDAALADIEKYYGEYDYTSGEGPNKIMLYEVYYDRQGMYDEEMTVMLDYLKANDFKKNIDDGGSYQGGSLGMTIYDVNKILDKVSPEKKEEAVTLIGEELLEEYKPSQEE